MCGRRFATPRFGVRGSRGWAHSIGRPWVPTSSPLTCMVYLLPVLSYVILRAAKAFPPAHPPTDPDTMTNTALEATASWSGKKPSEAYPWLSEARRCNSVYYEITHLLLSVYLKQSKQEKPTYGGTKAADVFANFLACKL